MTDGSNANTPPPTISGWHWVAYSLIIIVLLILAANGFLFIFWNHISDPRVFISITLTSLFVLATTTTLAIIFLWGAKILDFDPSFVHWLGGATVAEVAGILAIIINFYFAGPTPKTQVQTQAAQEQTQPAQQPSSVQPLEPGQPVQAPSKTPPAPKPQTAPQPQ